jgi:hypothetical protein
MPTPLELLTKPLQIGAQVAFGAIANIQKLVQGLTGNDPHDAAPPRDESPPARPKPAPRPKPLDDATITRKVETILFRDDSVDKGKIDVNTVGGVVSLRGVAKTPEQIKELEAKALEIPEVKQVENHLHLPKTPPPKRPRTKGSATPRKRTPKRTTAERKATPAKASAEPSPKELAAKGEGRRPAPLGASSQDGSG